GHAPDCTLVLEGRSEGLEGGGVPEPRRRVQTGRGDDLAVGAEGHGQDVALVLEGRAEGPEGGGVPEPRRRVHTGRGDGPAVGAEGHVQDPHLLLEGRARGAAAPPSRAVLSQSRAVWSSLAVATALPSGLKATPRTAP